MSTQRPTGITILAILFIILAVLSFGWGLLQLGVGAVTGVAGSIVGADNMASFGGSNVTAGILGMGSGVYNLVVAIGLLMLKKWAWILALIGVGINVLQGVFGLFSGGLVAFCCGLAGLAIPAAILYYLTRPEVQKAFGRG